MILIELAALSYLDYCPDPTEVMSGDQGVLKVRSLPKPLKSKHFKILGVGTPWSHSVLSSKIISL